LKPLTIFFFFAGSLTHGVKLSPMSLKLTDLAYQDTFLKTLRNFCKIITKECYKEQDCV